MVFSDIMGFGDDGAHIKRHNIFGRCRKEPGDDPSLPREESKSYCLVCSDTDLHCFCKRGQLGPPTTTTTLIIYRLFSLPARIPEGGLDGIRAGQNDHMIFTPVSKEHLSLKSSGTNGNQCVTATVPKWRVEFVRAFWVRLYAGQCGGFTGGVCTGRGRRWPCSSPSSALLFCLPLTEEPGAAGKNETGSPASRTMNGALYISFFQGQLESALEQVVQLAVQEITKSVGGSLGSMLLDTASKEQENQRLRARLQGGDGKAKGAEEPGGTKERQRGSSLGFQTTDAFRLEQKRRAVDQLKVVMEQVLEFAVCELTKIVEDSFDDLLLELTKTERENEELRERVRETEDKRVVEEEPQEKRTDSPGSSEGAGAKEQGQEPAENTHESESDRPAVITVSQDWVPILDKVFGQKWCSDLWQIKELSSSKEECPALGSGVTRDVDGLVQESLAPAPQRNAEVTPDPPQWLQAHDTEVVTSDPQCTSVSSSVGDESQLKSPSMLHRLLTLPSQLLEDDNEESMEALSSLADPEELRVITVTPGQSGQALQQEKAGDEEEEEEEEEEEHESSRNKGGKKLHVCKECGKKFSRSNLLKIHRQTHKEKETGIHCPQCGKNFSQLTKLQAHLRTHSGKTT
ncbi:zinc finger protein with KRAB and SCAN domains 3 [Colossoma macropomum]|uniref:zinc finger protein with KRAB and SCAN domains 3 n=1 Tax=Colossoma macropomum TaxID=42526 RepID=UPI0018651B7A|nr:zinc finger protein with KRAB and SCAN domains 3 [Colossoma macropomum]